MGKSKQVDLLVPYMPADLIVEVAGEGACYNDGSPLTAEAVTAPVQEVAPPAPVEVTMEVN
jgi:hypothetical protein